MKSTLRVLAGLSFAALLSACSSIGAGTSLPASQPPSAGGIDTLGRYVAPNVREVCPRGFDLSIAYCDALVRTDVSGDIARDVAGYGPADLQAAYSLPSSTHGTGQTIAIVDAYGYPSAESDLATYRSHFGLPACTTSNGCFQKLNQAGNPGPYPPSNPSWDPEQALDIDMISAVCPNCHIMLVEATAATGGDLGAADDTAARLGANAISNSWGGGGNSQSHFNHPGHIILASSGDSGYRGGTQTPAAFPTVVSVGGTHLTRGGGTRGWNETVWSGTGSGCSPQSKPSWQHDSGCSHRTMNDVAAVADPNTGVAVYIHGWAVYGGTSVSSPLLAGVYGLAGNAGSLNAGQSLYTNASSLFDITSGSNGRCSPAYLCHAEVGYDGPTGNGTPNGIGAF